MKFEEVEVGQILEDVHGNKHEVIDISNGNDYYKVLVKCIEFKKSVRVDPYTALTGINQTLWILKDRAMLLSIDDGPGKFIKDNFYSSLALSNNLESIVLETSIGTKRHYLLGQQSTIDKVGLTLSEMTVVEDDYLTINNIKNGMKVIDGLGNEYVVIDYDGVSVKLICNIKFTSMNGESKNIDTVMRVLYYNINMPEYACTTKDFQIVKGN